MACGIAVVLAGAALGAAGASPPGTAAAATATPLASAGPAGTSPGAAAPGSRLWIAHYNGPPGTDNIVASMVLSPDGSRVFVTGNNGRDYGTVAYRAASGTRLWARHHSGPAGFREYGGATALAFSPDGRTVFVTGDVHSPGTPSGTGYATIAYRAADGTQLWAVTGGPLASTGGAAAVAVSPDGRTVFVTGHDTVAYRATTGAQLWASPSLDGGYATALAVSPDGRKVFVTGPAFEPGSGSGRRPFTAVAFGAATGTRLWVNRYLGPRSLGGAGQSVAVSPGGRRVFVAGDTAWLILHRQADRYAVLAYRA
jgi:DNA-binding beta-propeller fold protein YncE